MSTEVNPTEKIRFIVLILYLIGLFIYGMWDEIIDKNTKSMKKFVHFKNFVWLCAFVVLLWVAWLLIIPWLISDWAHRGIAGDMFGGLNTLFTGLAFAGLVFTIFLQKTQLKEAEDEQVRQRFENIFFQLLNSFNQLIYSTEIVSDGEVRKSHDAFVKLFQELNGSYILYDRQCGDINENGLDLEKITALVNKKYSLFYDAYQAHLGHYYRTLYHIFKFIYLSSLRQEDKDFYAHLVRAQLSDQQVVLLFYNCFSKEGRGFKFYVEEYTLLKHLPEQSLPVNERTRKLLRSYYEESALFDKKRK